MKLILSSSQETIPYGQDVTMLTESTSHTECHEHASNLKFSISAGNNRDQIASAGVLASFVAVLPAFVNTAV